MGGGSCSKETGVSGTWQRQIWWHEPILQYWRRILMRGGWSEHESCWARWSYRFYPLSTPFSSPLPLFPISGPSSLLLSTISHYCLFCLHREDTLGASSAKLPQYLKVTNPLAEENYVLSMCILACFLLKCENSLLIGWVPSCKERNPYRCMSFLSNKQMKTHLCQREGSAGKDTCHQA